MRYKLVALPSQLKLLSGDKFKSLIMSNPIVVINYFATLIFGFAVRAAGFALAGALAFAGAFGLAGALAGALAFTGAFSATGAVASTTNGIGVVAAGSGTLYGADGLAGAASTGLAEKPNKRLIKSIISIS
jgi:hypothetical protein